MERDPASLAAGSPPAGDAGRRLARAVSLLVELEAEQTVRERESQLRALAADALRIALAGMAFLVAAVLLSYAIVRALETATSAWLAASVVAAGWLVVAAALAVPVVRRIQRVSLGTAADRSARLALAEAEAASAAAALASIVAGEIARAEERRLVGAAERELAGVEGAFAGAEGDLLVNAERMESEALPALGELTDIIGQTGQVGLRVLRRLLP
jgi:hypothetical protein